MDVNVNGSETDTKGPAAGTRSRTNSGKIGRPKKSSSSTSVNTEPKLRQNLLSQYIKVSTEKQSPETNPHKSAKSKKINEESVNKKKQEKNYRSK